MQHNNTPVFDRLIATGSYLTLGLIGFIWFIINVIITKTAMSKFLVYNLIQSFILSMVYAVISLVYETFMGLLMSLPFIGNLFKAIHIFLFQTPIYHSMCLVHFLVFIFLIYLSIFSILGKLPYVPIITDTAKKLYG